MSKGSRRVKLSRKSTAAVAGVMAAAAAGGIALASQSGHAAAPTPRYADYLNQTSAAPCPTDNGATPTGGWTCFVSVNP